jgi:MFS family permease
VTSPASRLFTPRFFVMCGFSFTVFLSAFMLLPTAPFRIVSLGGSTLAAGMFLGLLTYASAFSAPVTGAIADRVGKRAVLIACSLVIAGFSVAYAFTTSYRLPLVLVVFHGVFWSALLSSSAAYMTDIIPETRRAEGIGYWGLSTILAIAVAPSVGFLLYHRGWAWVCLVAAGLNLLMAGIAARLPETPVRATWGAAKLTSDLVEWRVLFTSLTLFLYSFGYGGITSFVALYADSNGVVPKEIYFTTFSIVILATRPLAGRLADTIGHKKVFFPCLFLIALGLMLLALHGTRPWLVASAVLFGSGFGTAYPVYAAYVMKHVDPARRGAAFGGILAAFDTGIGTGSMTMGWIISHAGFRPAFAVAAALACLAAPYFLVAEKRLLRPPPAAAA